MVTSTATEDSHQELGFQDLDLRRRWSNIKQRVYGMASLQPDWDGAGATPPQSLVLANAVALLDRARAAGFSPPDRISPDPDGGIIVEWEGGEIYIEVEITPGGVLEWMREGPSGTFEHWEQRSRDSQRASDETSAGVDDAGASEDVVAI